MNNTAYSAVQLLILGVVLSASASLVIQSASIFAKKLAVKSFLLGFFLLGMLTTVPEMFVAFQAVRDGVPQLSVGNLLGGSILLLSFVMGVGAIFLKRVVLDHGMTVKDILFSSIVIAAPSVVLLDGQSTRVEGALLLIIYIAHVLFVAKGHHVVSAIEHPKKGKKSVLFPTLLFIVGLFGVAVSSHFMVQIAESLAHALNISPFVIGLFLITIGTNLPELSLMVTAIWKKKNDLAFGDILGSAVINTPILGIVCLISPFSVTDSLRTQVTLGLLFLISLFFYLAASSKRDVTRKEGVVLLSVYVIFVVFEVFFGS